MKAKEVMNEASKKLYGAKNWAEKKFIGVRCKAACGVGTALGVLGGTENIFADTNNQKTDIKDYSFLESKDNGTFNGLTKTVQETGGSFYRLMLVIGISGLAIMLLARFLSLAFAKSGQKRDENKSNIMWVFLAGVGIFSTMTIIGMIKTFASKL